MTEFKITAIGDVKKRVTLGSFVGVEMFRILRVSMVNIITDRIGEKEAREAIYLTGKAVGGEIAKTFLDGTTDLNGYVKKFTDLLAELKVALVKVISVDLKKGKAVIQVDECASCSGMPNIGETICYFEGGIIAGVLKFFFKKEVDVVETKCWAKGDNICEFEVTIQA